MPIDLNTAIQGVQAQLAGAPGKNKLARSALQKYLDQLLGVQSIQSQTPSYLGSNYNYLQDTIKQGIEGKNPIFDELLGNAKRKIGAVTDRNVRDVQEQSAQSGFRGIGANKINEAYRTEADAVGGVADNLAMQELNYKNNMISNLLGLNQFEGGTNFNVANAQRDQMNFNRQMNFQEDQSDNWLGNLLGSLLGVGGQLGSAALLEGR